jgi:hypothetical protein
MSVILDILGSTFIGGMLLLLILKLNLFASTASYSSDTELKLQQGAKTLAEIINYDLRKIGYKYDGVAITLADSNAIEFYTDMQPPGISGHGTDDVIKYTVLDSSHAAGTTNPKDIVMVRILNGTDSLTGPSLGLVRMKFTYLDSTGVNTIPYLSSSQYKDIKYIKTELWVEASDPINDMITDSLQYQRTYWEFTIHPRNI